MLKETVAKTHWQSPSVKQILTLLVAILVYLLIVKVCRALQCLVKIAVKIINDNRKEQTRGLRIYY